MAPASVAQDEHLVAFRLAGETYGVSIAIVNEIIRYCEITQVPRVAACVRGVINLRGKVIPVIDLRSRLGLSSCEETRSTRIIVVEAEIGVIGMVVDAVSEVLRLSRANIEPPSTLVADIDADMIRGVGKYGAGLVILLDVERVLRLDR